MTRQSDLATALGATILGPSTMQLGHHLIVASVLGVVRVDGCAVGMWNDGTDTLAARVRALIAGSRVTLGPVAVSHG